MGRVEITNRKAYHDYFIEDTIECGIELRGNEVKSIRNGMCSIKEAWVEIKNRELIVHGMHITAWEKANKFDVDEKRDKKLLAHKCEIIKLRKIIEQDGMTLIPLEVKEKEHRVKVILAICKGKHSYDKRESLKAKDIERELRGRYK